jgi:F-type H+-transporting ATPase subunit b
VNQSFTIYSPLAVAPTVEQMSLETAPPPEAAPPVRGEMDVSANMVLLTWVSFLTAAYLLYKLAWKPVLAALDKREQTVKKVFDELHMARVQVELLQEKQQQIIAEADLKAKEIIDHGRQAALGVAAVVEIKAKEEARQIVEGAQKDILEARDRVIRDLRRESADLAIELAGKLVRKNLDEAANRELTKKLIEEL